MLQGKTLPNSQQQNCEPHLLEGWPNTAFALVEHTPQQNSGQERVSACEKEPLTDVRRAETKTDQDGKTDQV